MTTHEQLSSLLAQASQAQRAGQFEQAEALCYRILQADSTQPDVWNLLARLHFRSNRPASAVEHLQRAIELRPNQAILHVNLAEMLRPAGRLHEAETSYRRALELEPQSDAAWMGLGIVLCRLKQPAAGLAAFDRAIELNPHSADARNGLGIAYKKLARFEEAVASYRQALAVRPDFVEALGNLGNALCELQRYDEAEAHCRRALELSPNSSWVHNSLGMALYKQSRWQEAESVLRRALELDGAAQIVYQNLGTLLYERGRPFEAEPIFRRALQDNPSDDGLLCSLGNSLQDMGRLDEATANFDAALRVNPACANARFNRSLVRLLRGDFVTGWHEYEWRWQRTSAPSYGPFSQPRWDGQPLDGRTLLLICEQGFGDTLQFIRLAALINKRGGRVVLVCPSALIGLLRSCRAIDELVIEGEPLPSFDVHLPLMSLPMVLGLVREQDIPATVPYLAAEPERVEAWRAKLSAESGRKIGVVWQGNPQHTRDALRSIPLGEFLPLTRIPAARLYSLQKGPGREQLARFDERHSMVDLADELPDFAETAAVCQALDLVITCDSACAHLAGALGRPVWVVLPAATDWRWQLEREDSPWYPTMRLFRQKVLGDWPEVFIRVASALQSFG